MEPAKQAAFIKRYDELMNQLAADEAVMFADAVHPTHAVRPVGCWAPKEVPIAITQTSGRDRLNIHGTIDLETGNTRMIEVATMNALSTIMLLMAIETTPASPISEQRSSTFYASRCRETGIALRRGHRQLPRHRPREFSGSRIDGV